MGELKVCNQFLEDFPRLNSVFLETGYLFFREILDRDQVHCMKADFVRVLQGQGAVQTGESEPIWTGVALEQIDDDALYGLESHLQCWESQRMVSLIEKIFHQPVFMFRNINIRFSLPRDEKYVTPAHQDHFYIRQTPNFRTVWIPLMDIDRQMGGLAIASGSHKLGLMDHLEDEIAESYILRGRKQKGIPRDRIDLPWLTTDYRAGDLLMFHSHTIHRALPNHSDKIRLSMDNRFQPRSEPVIWQAEKSIPELRRYRTVVTQMAEEEGASEELTENLIIEMMNRGLEAERHHVRDLVAELSR